MRFVRRKDRGVEVREFFVRLDWKRIENLERLNGSWHELTQPGGGGAISYDRSIQKK
jgi:hypothetical protein